MESKYSKTKKIKFILSFIGTLFYGISGLISFGISQFSVYITSYFHHNNISIDMQYGNLITPIVLLSNSLSSPLGGFFETKFGFYKTLIVSNILIELIILIFINQMSVFLSFILIILLGMVSGVGMGIPGKNLYFYYPKKAGTLSSFIMASFILFAIVINIVGEKMMNPEQYTLKTGEQFYPLEISKNYIKFYKYFLYFNPFLLVISLLLIKRYDKKYDELIETENNNKNNNRKNIKDKENYKNNIKSAVINKRIWKIIGITTLTPFVLIFSRNTFRVYGALVSMSGKVLQYSQLFVGFSNILILPVWGIINDKYNYNLIAKIVCIGCIIQTILFSIFIKSNTIYLLSIIFGSIFGSGFNSMMRLHILKVYGIKYSIEIGGIIGIFSSLFNILNGVLSFIISKYYHTGEELQLAYRYVYLFGLGFCCLGTFLALREKDDKFIYPYEKNINDKNDEESSNIVNSEENDEGPKEIELENTNSESNENIDNPKKNF